MIAPPHFPLPLPYNTAVRVQLLRKRTMNIRPLMYIFIFVLCLMFVMCVPFAVIDFWEINRDSRGFYDFMVIVAMGLYLFAFIVYVTLPVAGIMAIKDLPVEIKSQEFCTAANKSSWVCLSVHLIIIALGIMIIIVPPDDRGLLAFITYTFLTLGILANLTQILINILLYRKYRHPFLADALKTQALMILTIVFSIVIMSQILPHLE